MAATGEADRGPVTRLLVSWSEGDRDALDRLTPLVYRQLRHIAAAYLRRERPGHTMQPTALVHEAYLRLIDQKIANVQNRTHFFAIAANLMRQILVNHARNRQAAKRGGLGPKLTLDEAGTVGEQQQPPVDLLAVNEALDKLTQLDPRQGRIVEMRFFGGLTEDQVAEVLEVSPATVKREWRMAKLMLHNLLEQG